MSAQKVKAHAALLQIGGYAPGLLHTQYTYEAVRCPLCSTHVRVDDVRAWAQTEVQTVARHFWYCYVDLPAHRPWVPAAVCRWVGFAWLQAHEGLLVVAVKPMWSPRYMQRIDVEWVWVE